MWAKTSFSIFVSNTIHIYMTQSVYLSLKLNLFLYILNLESNFTLHWIECYKKA